MTSWREKLSASLALCEGNPLITGGSSHKRPAVGNIGMYAKTISRDVLINLIHNKFSEITLFHLISTYLRGKWANIGIKIRWAVVGWTNFSLCKSVYLCFILLLLLFVILILFCSPLFCSIFCDVDRQTWDLELEFTLCSGSNGVGGSNVLVDGFADASRWLASHTQHDWGAWNSMLDSLFIIRSSTTWCFPRLNVISLIMANLFYSI